MSHWGRSGTLLGTQDTLMSRSGRKYISCALLSRLVRPIRERTWWYSRVGAVGWPVFEHCEAAPTPLGGGTIAHSLIRPRTTIYVALGALLSYPPPKTTVPYYIIHDELPCTIELEKGNDSNQRVQSIERKEKTVPTAAGPGGLLVDA